MGLLGEFEIVTGRCVLSSKTFSPWLPAPSAGTVTETTQECGCPGRTRRDLAINACPAASTPNGTVKLVLPAGRESWATELESSRATYSSLLSSERAILPGMPPTRKVLTVEPVVGSIAATLLGPATEA